MAGGEKGAIKGSLSVRGKGEREWNTAEWKNKIVRE